MWGRLPFSTGLCSLRLNQTACATLYSWDNQPVIGCLQTIWSVVYASYCQAAIHATHTHCCGGLTAHIASLPIVTASLHSQHQGSAKGQQQQAIRTRMGCVTSRDVQAPVQEQVEAGQVPLQNKELQTKPRTELPLKTKAFSTASPILEPTESTDFE